MPISRIVPDAKDLEIAILRKAISRALECNLGPHSYAALCGGIEAANAIAEGHELFVRTALPQFEEHGFL